MPLEPLDPATVSFVLSMTESRWSHKARVVGFVGVFHGGEWVSARDVSRVVGRNRNRCQQMLNELEADRVLLRRLAAGTRPAWTEVNPDVAAWRNVPWVHDPDTIEARVALHEKHLRAAGTALERLVARPIGVTQADLVARLIAARLAPEDPSLWHPNAARDYGERGFGSDTPMRRAIGNGQSRAHGRGSSNGHSPTGLNGQNGHRDRDVGVGQPTAAETVTVDEEALTAARRAVLQRTVADGRGRHFINGAPLVQLIALVVRYPIGQILEAAERGPVGELVPGFIGWLSDNIEPPIAYQATENPRPAVESNPRANPRWLEARVVALRRQAAQCDAEGATEAGDTYRAELAECETDLASVLAQLTEGAP